MSAAEQPIPSEALVVADRMGVRGYRTHPLYPRAKNPVLNDWPNAASCDPADHAGWWPVGSERGLGWAMGVQGSGEFLVAVDVDVDKGGRDSLNQLGLENPWLVDLLMSGLFAQTGSGGFHFVIAVPPSVGAQLSNRARILPGIDIRSAGGQIAVFPSIHPNGRQYRWAEGHAPWEVDPVADERVCDLLVRLAERPAVASVPAAPRSSGGDTPADQVRQHERWESWLPRWGWTYLRTLPNGDQLWKRPGKTDRGHSAVLHPDGAFVIFSTEIPPILEAAGKPTRGGEGVSVSLFAAIAAYEHGGDQSAAGRWARQQPWFVGGSPATTGASGGTAVTPGSSDAPVAVPGAQQYLPDEFWSARPWFEHVRRTAWERMVCPDAVLLSVLVRWAVMVQPHITLPALVGGEPGTFDMLGIVVGPTSSGKSMAASVARALLTSEDPKIKWDIPLGSGEGIAQMYMVEELEETADGKIKKTGRQKIDPDVTQACHFTVDEGVAMMQQSKHNGSTLITTINSAISGQAIGQANAGPETRRIVPAGKVRFGVTMSMQADNAHLIFTQAMRSVGFSGRTILVNSVDIDPPEVDDLPEEMPDIVPLGWHRPTHGHTTTLQYTPAIQREIRISRRAGLMGQINDAHSHAIFLRCRIAGLLALADRRMNVTDEDWSLAGTLITVSEAVYAGLDALRQRNEAAIRQANGYARAEVDLAAESRIERVKTDELRDKIIAAVLGSPDGHLSNRDIRDLTSSKYRDRLRRARIMATESGRVVEGNHGLDAP